MKNNIIYNQDNEEYAIYIDRLIEKRKTEIFEFFHKEVSTKFNVYLYSSIEELVKGLKERGFGEHPNYMCACSKDKDQTINLFEPKDNPSDEEWSKEEYESVIFHELVHLIQFHIYGKQPEWLTEGVAKLLDGQYQKGKKWLLENYVLKYRLPDISQLQGNTFCTDAYNGYDLSYLMVSYLIDYYEKEKFLGILGDKELIESNEKDLVERAINYYKEIYLN